MRFLFILTQVEDAWAEAPPGEAERVYQQYLALEAELKAGGRRVESLRLRPAAEARTLRNLPGEQRSEAAGPWAGNPDVMGGLYIIECASAEEAMGWARRMPNYGHGAIEVRPIWDEG